MPGAGRATTPSGLEHSGPVFDRARRLASTLFGDADAAVVLGGDGAVWRSSDPEGRLPKDAPAAEIAVAEGRLVWGADASKDPRFKNRPRVKGTTYAQLYV